jgi:hypothetical protein
VMLVMCTATSSRGVSVLMAMRLRGKRAFLSAVARQASGGFRRGCSPLEKENPATDGRTAWDSCEFGLSAGNSGALPGVVT